MEITEARCVRLDNGSAVVGIGSITMDDILVLGSLKVIEGKNGLFVGFPNYKKDDGEYQDIYFPLNKELREDIQDAMLEAFEQASPAQKSNRGGNRSYGSGKSNTRRSAPSRQRGRSGPYR